MGDAELDCLEFGHSEGDDGICTNCNKTLKYCKECGDSTANDNLLCGGCDTEFFGMLSEDEGSFEQTQI